MTKSSAIIKMAKEKLDYYSNKKSNKKLISVFSDLKSKIEKKKDYRDFPISLFSNLIVHSFHKNPYYFMKTIYPDLRSSLKKQFEEKKFYKMEKYILKNFCFLEDEKKIFVIDGSFVTRMEKTGGKIVFDKARIYLTNKRIIVHSSDMKMGAVDLSVNLNMGDDYMLNYYKTMIFRRNFSRNDGENPCYGYEFPIFELEDVSSDNKKVKYSFNEGGKKHFCEIYPEQNYMAKPIEEMLKKLSLEAPIVGQIRKHCEYCGALVKANRLTCNKCKKIIL
ncbi:MAG: hypothetical protein JW891_02540 [Candidatus Lokiarchaeota archaeon]|nr:hypothetical protein [Candidatus Lokiarchaeota archaeon]